ncbi:hypothetical protein A2865_03565 [Candidatus Woesebacteria bacterium RIFCSPHIGHO2_01_FULL_39_17]|uniref:Uncharacterized protein n=1 Tax=Candidatus Woesebacteria bacterium RIFCSPLOWO2_01_FULL_39_14 TaxID=1802518 RepID=A0A1F8BJV0_9BACT|nr:MAG: hypothetical protein A2865_03565 [Candidatus Woesebacteria bacterium RIFCSPHIGHO2_01_FULL_39_17]OGM64346.1 MAG: hypothetical protein A3A52_05420 [Candidatus Woesebacteria bacterium RIFCSPLOWO2_01_FULL_39_14]
MNLVKNILRFIASYFVFVGGFLFIFAIGVLYAYLRPQGVLFNVVFLIITIGWVIFLIRYFWDLMEKNRKV